MIYYVTIGFHAIFEINLKLRGYGLIMMMQEVGLVKEWARLFYVAFFPTWRTWCTCRIDQLRAIDYSSFMAIPINIIYPLVN